MCSCRRLFFGLAVFPLLVGLCQGRADAPESVKERLFQAKKTYDGEVRKFRNSVAEFLDKREADARKVGNKKLVDQVKAEQKAFESQGEIPASCPAPLLGRMKAARADLAEAYAAAVKDYVRLKEDGAAEATEKEQQKFVIDAAFLIG